jgi:hypothetical protein
MYRPSFTIYWQPLLAYIAIFVLETRLTLICFNSHQPLELRQNWHYSLAWILHELLSRDHETGNPLAGLSGAQRARRKWACHLATRPAVLRDWFPYLNGTSQEPTSEDARKDGHIRGRSKLFMKDPG